MAWSSTPSGRVDGQMQTCGDAVDPGLRNQSGQFGGHDVAPFPMPAPHRTQMPLQRTAGHHRGQGQLRQHRVAQIGVALTLDEFVEPVARRHQPADAHRRGQRFRHAARVDDPIRAEAGERRNGRTVVAVLGVVVVLDDQPSARPPSRAIAADVRGRARRRTGTRAPASPAPRWRCRATRSSTTSPSPSTRIGGVSSPQNRSSSRAPSEPGSSTRDGTDPLRGKGSRHQSQGLRDAGNDDHTVRRCRDSTGPAQPRCHRLP